MKLFRGVMIVGAMVLLLMSSSLAYVRAQGPSTAMWLLVTASRAREKTIYRVTPDGRLSEYLTPPALYSMLPQWSYDGRWIVFMAEDDLYRMGPAGGNLVRLTNLPTSDYGPSWSPDSQWITFHSSGTGEGYSVFRVRWDGTALEQLSPVGIRAGDPQWSPEGGWLAYVFDDGNGNFDVFRMQPDGSHIQALTDNPAADFEASWSPDGQWIAFVSYREPENNTYRNAEIFVMRADGSDIRRITSNTVEDRHPVWSPDGQWIAFDSNRTGLGDIYRMRPDGSEVMRLTSTYDSEFDPLWSTDGQWIAFGAKIQVENRLSIRLVRADGRAGLTLPSISNRDELAGWSPVFDLPWRPVRLMLLGLTFLTLNFTSAFFLQNPLIHLANNIT